MTMYQALPKCDSFADLLPIARGVTAYLPMWRSRYAFVNGFMGDCEPGMG